MDYIPRRDTGFTDWFLQFKEAFNLYAIGLGFTAGDVTEVNDSFADWQTKFADHLSAATVAHAARQAKLDQREASERLVRRLVRQIQSNPLVSHQMRKEFGITVPKAVRTPIPAPKEAPFIELECRVRGQVTLHLGTQPTNERLNKFPPEAEFVQIFYRVEGGDWQFAAASSTSPFIHELDNLIPLVVEYRARYQNPRGHVGPWSETDTAYVPPVQSLAFRQQTDEEAA